MSRRNSRWVPKDKCGLMSPASSEEIDGFLRLLDDLEGLEFVGWSAMDPVFVIGEDSHFNTVRSKLKSLIDNNRFSSAGHCAYVVKEAGEPTSSNTILLMKIEDWMVGCIPNPMHDDPDGRADYIEERESDMSSRLGSKMSGSKVLIDRHVDSVGMYGQYQYLAIS